MNPMQSTRQNTSTLYVNMIIVKQQGLANPIMSHIYTQAATGLKKARLKNIQLFIKLFRNAKNIITTKG